MSVAIGVVRDEMVHGRSMECLFALRSNPNVSTIIFREGSPGSFDVARSGVARYFLAETDANWLLTIDTDMVYGHEELNNLLSHAQADDVLSATGIYFVGERPPRPCVVQRDDNGFLVSPKELPEERFPVQGTGGGFWLIHRQALLLIGSTKDTDREGPWYRQSAVGASGSVLEPDYALCQRLEQVGVTTWCYPDVFVGHIKPRVLGWE